MEITKRIIYLLQKHVRRELDEQELAELMAWAKHHPAFQQLLEEVSDEKSLASALHAFDQVHGTDPIASIARMEGRIATGIQAISEKHVQPVKTRPRMEGRIAEAVSYGAPAQELRQAPLVPKGLSHLRKWLPYAAAMLIAVTAAIWVFFGNQIQPTAEIVDLKTEDIAPGGNRATLTLADGRTIDLNEEQSGIVVGDGITYLDGSTVLGEQVSMGTNEPAGPERNYKLASSQVHTLTTPKGGTYQLTLADGSKVWLNASSTLTYPSRFDGNERVVELEGEGYFEVAKDTERPFKVRSQGQEVDVLGTEFNVSTYPEEADTRTTLVKGSVQIVNTQSNLVHRLQPGEQAIVAGSELRKATVNTDLYTAWKDGFFYFDRLPTRIALAQLARWYDLDVVYDGKLKEVNVYGYVDRNKPLQAVLTALENSGLKFKVRQSGNRKQLIVLGEQ